MVKIKIMLATAGACILVTLGMIGRLLLSAGLFVAGDPGIEGPE